MTNSNKTAAIDVVGLNAELGVMRDAIMQMLDDMGPDGHSVCEAVKQLAMRAVNAHYCPDWDYLPICPSDQEMEGCTCHTHNAELMDNNIDHKPAFEPPLECGVNPLPCPFCGSASISTYDGSTYRWMYAGCDECGAQAGEVRIDTLATDKAAAHKAAHKDAINEWNKRHNVVRGERHPRVVEPHGVR